MPIRSPFALLPVAGLLLGLVLAVMLRPTYQDAATKAGTPLPTVFSSESVCATDPNQTIPLRVLLSRDPVDTPYRASLESLLIAYMAIGFMGAGALLFAVPRPRS